MAWRSALSKNLQELRVQLCQSSAPSQGAREFVLKNYAEMKAANPLFPILIREANNAEAKLIARYEFGVEKSVSIQNDTPSTILTKLQDLIKAGQSLPK